MAAIAGVIRDGDVTPDMGGNLGTVDVGRRLAAWVSRELAVSAEVPR